MHRTPHPHGRSLGRHAVALVSVLALLAFACFPVLAQAESVYETEPTTLPHETVKAPTEHNNPHHSESSPQANASGTPGGGGGSEEPGSEGSGSQSGASKQGGSGTSGGGGQAHSKQVNGAGNGGAKPAGNVQTAKPVANTTEADNGSSSPLVPILIAVAVLAAISIAAVLVRQRRGSDSTISPKAS
jgi:cobalamin biosynthesis Mg chelatase CobN